METQQLTIKQQDFLHILKQVSGATRLVMQLQLQLT